MITNLLAWRRASAGRALWWRGKAVCLVEGDRTASPWYPSEDVALAALAAGAAVFAPLAPPAPFGGERGD